MNEKLELEINLALDSLQNQDIRSWFKYFYNLALEDVKEEVKRRALKHECHESSVCQERADEDYMIIDFIEKQKV